MRQGSSKSFIPQGERSSSETLLKR